MKKTLLSLFSLSITLISINVLLSSSSGGRASVANAGNTGAPSEATTCRNCHGSGFGATVSITLRDTSGTTVTSYNPGDTMDVEVEVNTTSGSPSRYGFQIVSLDSSNNSISDWINPDLNTQISTGGRRTYAEHDGASTSSTFEVQWVAPVAGTGTVTFYAGGAAVNGNRNTSGDGGNTTSVQITENVTTSIQERTINVKASIYPNPAKDQLNLQFGAPIERQTELEVIDLTGKTVMLQALAVGNAKSTFSIEHLPQGLYLANVRQQGNLVQQLKFIKQ